MIPKVMSLTTKSLFSIGEESLPDEDAKESKAPEWVGEVRKQNRKHRKTIKDLESKLAKFNEKKPLQLPERPKLEDFDHDTEKYDDALFEWHDKKREIQSQEDIKKAETESQQKKWDEKLQLFNDSKENLKLKVVDYEDAVLAVEDELSVTQRGILIQGADDPAKFVGAIGKNSKKLKELASIKDPVKFAFAVAKLESNVVTTSRNRPTTKPERTLKGSGGANLSSGDAHLDRLREEADRTGDLSEVVRYRSKLKNRS